MADSNPGDKPITSNNKPMWGFLRRDDQSGKYHMPVLEVHDIPKHIETKEQLEAVFAPDVCVKKIKFANTTRGEQSPSFAFVKFHTREDLRKGITIANGTNSPYIQLSAIPKDMPEHDLRMWFQNCGEIENIRISGDVQITAASATRRAIVIFRREDDVRGAVTHLCNVGLGNLPFKISGLVTQTQYQIPPKTVYAAAKSQQNLGLHEVKPNACSGKFSAKKHPRYGTPTPSERYPLDPNAPTFQQRGSPQRQILPPSNEEATEGLRNMLRLSPRAVVTNIAPAPAPPPLHAIPNQQQQQRHQQSRPYQLPPPAAPPGPYQQPQQLGPYSLPGAQAGQNQPHMFPLDMLATQVQGYNAPTVQQVDAYSKQQTPTAGAAQGFFAQYPQQPHQLYSQQPPQMYSQQLPQMYSQQQPQHYSQHPPQMYSQQPPQMYSQQPPQMYPRQLPQMYPQQPPQNYSQHPPQMYSQQPPQMYSQQLPQMYSQQPPQMYSQQRPLMYSQQPPQMYSGQPPQKYPDPPATYPFPDPQSPPKELQPPHTPPKQDESSEYPQSVLDWAGEELRKEFAKIGIYSEEADDASSP